MEKSKIKEFTAKAFDDISGAMASGLVYIGVRTGLFRAMSGCGPMTLLEVVERSGLTSRYVEEWLNGMVCSGYLCYDPQRKTFELPDEHAFMLASDQTDHFIGGLYYAIPMMLQMAPKIAEVFFNGGGIPFTDYGDEGIEAIDIMNRGMYEHRFADYWLKSLPVVYDQLTNGANVLDFGCGTGRVILTLSSKFPRSRFVGLDTDNASITKAKKHAESIEHIKNVEFLCEDVQQFEPSQKFDLITVCDCVHDLADPINTLRRLRRLLHSSGTMFIVEPKVADRLEDNINSIGALYYGMSVFHCMTQSLADGGLGLGTCMGSARLKELSEDAGFGHFTKLEIKSQTTSFYSIRH
tara:strand:+ start:173 stop:1228 length:1056 start_codon:yes stop_codon:yes gene_type:complete